MRSLCKVTLTLGVIALLAGPASAQRPPFPGGGMFQGGGQGGTALLRNQSVQQELKMKEGQVEKLEAVERELREKMREETYKALAKVLDADQLKRFKQIELQQSLRARGPDIFLDPQYESTLKLTAQQKEKLTTINDDYRKDSAELRKTGGAGGNFQEIIEKTTALRKEAMTRATDVLTAQQKGAWKDMTGAEFEMRFDGGRFGGGGKPGKPGKPDRN